MFWTDLDEGEEYEGFVEERHTIWLCRQMGQPQPWTADPILDHHKFTNVFRVLDPGSQYALALGNEYDSDPLDVLGRVFLYRYTNLPATWDWLRQELGHWPTARDLVKAKPRDLVFRIIDRWRASGQKVLSGAYVILPQPGQPGDKVRQALDLTARVITETGEAFLRATSQRARFDVLRSHYGVGDFMAMQILTDWGYSQFGEDAENDFIIAGPGAVRGAKAVAPGRKPEETIRLATRYWQGSDVHLLVDGRPRYPSLMDVQNTFCEFSKYVRFRDRGGLLAEKAPYVPAHPGPQPLPQYPTSWGQR